MYEANLLREEKEKEGVKERGDVGISPFRTFLSVSPVQVRVSESVLLVLPRSIRNNL
jgi:hypothetical protein